MELRVHDPEVGDRVVPAEALRAKAEFVVGRTREADLVLDRKGVSRRHCAIVRQGDGWILRDLGSSNGTLLNGQRLQGESPLRPGDRIIVGPCVLYVAEIAGGAEAAEATAEATAKQKTVSVSAAGPASESSPTRRTKRTALQRRQRRIRPVTVAVLAVTGAVGLWLGNLYLAEAHRSEVRGRLDRARRLQEDHRHEEALAAAGELAAADDAEVAAAAGALRDEVRGLLAMRDEALKAYLNWRLEAALASLPALPDLTARLKTIQERYGSLLAKHREFKGPADLDLPLRDLIGDGIVERKDGVAVRLADRIEAAQQALRGETEARYRALREEAEGLAKAQKYDEALRLYRERQPAFAGVTPHASEIAGRVVELEKLAAAAEAERRRRETERLRQEALAAARRTVEEGLGRAEAEKREGRYRKAQGICRELAAAKLDDPALADLRTVLDARLADLEGLASLQQALLDALAKGPVEAPPAAKAAAGNEEGLTLDGGAKRWSEIPPATLADLYARCPLSPEQRLSLAVFCRDRGLTRRAGRVLYDLQRGQPAAAAKVQALLARWLEGGAPPAPAGFEFREELGRWVPKGWRIPDVPRELRGVWIATVANIDWPSRKGLSSDRQKAELVAMLDLAASMRLNAIFLQVRPACDALYESKLEPWSEFLSGTAGRPPDPPYDPLAFAVAEAHARGLVLHAWFNPYRARSDASRSDPPPNHVARTHPELVRTYGKQLWLDPGLEEVRKLSHQVMLDVVHRYDVDGIHMDDYFYPYPISENGRSVDFPDEPSWTKYRSGGGKLERADWRRKNVDDFVRELSELAHREKPLVQVTISPFGIWQPGYPKGVVGMNPYASLYADARKWLREGWVDALVPQLYWPIESRGQPFVKLLQWWKDENVKGRQIWPGLFTSETGHNFSRDEIRRQIEESRKVLGDGAGHVHFSQRALSSNQSGLADQMREVYERPALVPEMAWLGKGRPAAPKARIAKVGADAVEVAVEPGSLTAGAFWWVVQVERGGAWKHDVLPASKPQASVRLPGREGPPDTVVVFSVNRVGMAGEKTVLNVEGP